MSRLIDMVGQVFGKLLVIKRVENDKSGHTRWLCRCDCGNEVIVIGNSLRKGYTKSCRGRGRLPKGQAAFNLVYRMYRYKAKKRNLVFDLTKEDFSFITQMNCHYCGREPANIIHSGGRRFYGDYVYNGIDRIDNDRGYTLDNVVPCCKICNRAKKEISKEMFLSWARALVEYQLGKRGT